MFSFTIVGLTLPGELAKPNEQTIKMSFNAT